MSLNIKKLKVSLPANPFGQAIKDFTHLSNQLEVLSKSAGIENNNFRVAYGEVCKALASKERVEDVLYSSIHVRALALSLHTDAKKNVSLTRRLLNKITEIVKKP
ncbi:transcriptional regulator, partial [Vibrio parahaemolyticus]|nr:transcriptional regulator [Vibrio parahaemolyticus]